MERDFHRWLKSQQQSAANVSLGIGDDAAILNLADEAAGIAVCTDTIAEGTHFDLQQHELERVGRKALAVNLSDIAAMGAWPLAVLLNFVLPRSFSLLDSQRLYRGVQQLAQQFSVPIVGGDTNTWDGPVVLGATVIGRQTLVNGQPNAWRLDRAQPGDRLIVSGAFGGSILGHHLDFVPRIELANHLIKHHEIHAATDASDSLSLDVAAMAAASQVGVVIESTSVPVSPAAKQLAQQSGQTALERALSDGEDFELLLAVPESALSGILQDEVCADQLTLIGHFVRQPGFWLRQPDDSLIEFTPAGYSH